MFKISKGYVIRRLAKSLHTKEILNMSHHTTLFSQTLSFIPRHIFQKKPYACAVLAIVTLEPANNMNF